MRITSGVVPSAQKVLVYGPEGIGKSTFAAQFPDPLFIDTEGSTKHMDVKRLDQPSSWTMLKEQVIYVRLHPEVCRTLVIDTADWAEQLAIAHVCAKPGITGIEDFGYGKGYTYLAEEFGNLLNVLTEVIERGVHVVLTAHAQIRKFEQPDESAAYDRWELKLQKKTAPLVKEWCDMVLFANYKTFAVKDSKTSKVTAAGGERVMYASHRPAWDAKNRHGLPDEMPFAFTAIAKALTFERKLEPQAAPDGVTIIPLDSPDAIPAIETAIADMLGEAMPEPPGPVDVPAHLKKLFDLMAADSVTPIEVQKAVASKGYFPEGTPIEKYPADFVEAVLVKAWPTVREAVQGLRSIPFE